MYMLVYPGEIQTLNLLMVLEKGEEKGSQGRGEGRKRGGRGGKTGRRRQGEPASPPPTLLLLHLLELFTIGRYLIYFLLGSFIMKWG